MQSVALTDGQLQYSNVRIENNTNSGVHVQKNEQGNLIARAYK